tara:strand:+ start:812 stop:1057 length:246 start_codon:yes stop_codon:yes gene_type:complete
MITGENIETRLARILEIQYGYLDANAFSLILDLIEKEKQALNIANVSNQRELLIAYEKTRSKTVLLGDTESEIVDEVISNL